MSEETPGMPGMKMMRIRIDTADGRVAAKVGVADVPIRLSETLPWMHALQDRLVSLAVLREEKAGHSISCKAGCGACCRQLVPLAIPEAYDLQRMVDAMPPERRGAVEQRFDEILATLESTGVRAILEDEKSSPDELDTKAREYFRLQLPCPFLENESCGIHEDRPLACREYNVTTPAEWCKDPFSRPIGKIRVAKRLTTVMARLAHVRLRLPARLVPLVLSLKFARENPSLDDHSWPGPDLWEQLIGLVGQEQPSESRVQSKS